MQTGLEEVQSETAAGATALVTHLRRNPADVRRPVSELAKEFNLPESFVRTVIEGVSPRRIAAVHRVNLWETFGAWFSRTKKGISTAWEALVRYPLAFFAAVLVLGVLIQCFVIPYVAKGRVPLPEWLSFGSQSSVSAYTIATLITWGVVVVLKLACIARLGQVRFAAWSSFFTALAIGSAIALSDSTPSLPSAIFAFISAMFLTIPYLGMAVLFAVVGGYTQIKGRKQYVTSLSRLELLTTYLNLSARLNYPRADWSAPAEWKPFLWFRAKPLHWILIPSIITSLLIMGFAVTITMLRTGPVTSVIQAVLGISILAVWLGELLLVGLVATQIRSVPRAWLFALYSAVASWAVGLIPLPDYGPHKAFSLAGLIGMVFTTVLHGVIMTIGVVGGQIQYDKRRRMLLEVNDPATLASEMLQVQMLLSQGSTMVTVLVIDAAKSSQMKASADPLVAEFSFRAYQAFIQRHCSVCAGRVHATAGDGAVVAFDSPAEAMAAAEAMLADLDRFNQEENRLKSPFLVRIGIHSGEVVADLDKVVFTEVIDIAAHIEGAAPVGGIAVSEPVTSQFPHRHFELIHPNVDGFRVYALK
ncbi:MAG: adenylate/guanylate cyclase domain-containing protein [Armatimonadetes bacterium]|nr:adenylate/guanylate cyclase domain-containing protein [Armatimonadota bacterium]